jgi:hypothetical protein
LRHGEDSSLWQPEVGDVIGIQLIAIRSAQGGVEKPPFRHVRVGGEMNELPA